MGAAGHRSSEGPAGRSGGRGPRVVVIGAGPAGLTAAYVLATRHGLAPTVLEADDVVGGLSRTVERDGWRFDIGGHRFFTKVPEVQALWEEILPGKDFLVRPRMSRIYYQGRFFDYPLRLPNALANLGPLEAARCLASYARARMAPRQDQSTLEGWIESRFGRRLYQHFFRAYTEKLWGVPAAELPADFAAQRIRELSLGRALAEALRPGRSAGQVTSLVDRFFYPAYGPGMLWDRCRLLAEAAGARVVTAAPVGSLRRVGQRVVAVGRALPDGTTIEHPCDHVISSMPLGALVEAFSPPAPAPVRAAARALRHRDFLTVALVVPAAVGFPDNWIYVHAPEVRVGRIQNYGSWSPFLVRGGRTVLGMEYFVWRDDALWRRSDQELVRLATDELTRLGLAEPGTVETGYVVRVDKAYPFYDAGYRQHVGRIAAWLGDHAVNVQPVGRNGLHRYNNQDHSMVTALRAVDNITTGAGHDVWAVNLEEEYHEHGAAGGGGGGAAAGRRRWHR
jgi:protoporphyrinogen oxidase